MESTLAEMEAVAKRSHANAVVPFSGFGVGAAVLVGDKIYGGCNIEAPANRCREFGSCGERVGIHAALAGSPKGSLVKHVTLWTPTPFLVTPCGGCREEIFLASDGKALVTSVAEPDQGSGSKRQVKTRSIMDLLPPVINDENADHRRRKHLEARDTHPEFGDRLLVAAHTGLASSSIPGVFSKLIEVGASLLIVFRDNGELMVVNGGTWIEAVTRMGLSPIQCAIAKALGLAQKRRFDILEVCLTSAGDELPDFSGNDRQRVFELAPAEGDVGVYLTGRKQMGFATLSQILPVAFGPKDLNY